MISRSVSTSDYHTAGEPFRIVVDPPVQPPGESVADRRARALHSADAQGLRELLCLARVGVGGPELKHESIVQSLFTGAVVGTTTVAGRPAVVPEITGLAHRTAEHTFVVDPADPLVPGFVLR